MELLHCYIVTLLNKIGVTGEIELTTPPNPEMGDLAFACFGVAKEWKKSPAECAREITEKLRNLEIKKFFERIEAVGPYVNFYLNPQELARLVLDNQKNKKAKKQKSKIMVEFAHPNTHKPVHIGHLRNMITGESIVRLLESQGYKVVRANYQGDVGMHIAKCLWGILNRGTWDEERGTLKTVQEKARYLGKVYTEGGQAYEKNEKAKKEIEEINAKIYAQDKSIKKLYELTKKWSLDYFDYIYKRVGVKKFDRLYFESETFARGKQIVLDGLKKGIFKESQGAIIFEGSKYGLHDRVFINSMGLPVYEAKDQALAEMQFKEFNPTEILHLVAKEQTEYFKVIFKALEFTLPNSKDKEKHLIYGWVSLKEGKMSSRTGQVVLAEWLLDEVEKRIEEIMRDREIGDKKLVIRKVADSAVKYSMLKTGISNDIVFDLDESISLSGDSGPYLLYIVARINSVFKKAKRDVIPAKAGIRKSLKLAMDSRFRGNDNLKIEPQEKQLLLELARFEEAFQTAAEERDPSQVAKYLFTLAQAFNNFYQTCPVLQAEGDVKNFRLRLVMKVREVMASGLELLGIEAVEEM